MLLSGLQRLILEAAAEGRTYEAPGSEAVVAQEYEWLRGQGLLDVEFDGGSLVPDFVSITIDGRAVLLHDV